MLCNLNVNTKTKYHKMRRNSEKVAHDAHEAICVKCAICVHCIETAHGDQTDAKDARWAKAMQNVHSILTKQV